MRKRILVHKLIPGLLLLLLPLLSASQTGYWQQEVQYTIDVSLNDADHTLNGFEKIKYTNHSPDTLRFIWFHIWPNAYKNDRTAFTDQELENGSTRFYFSGKEDKGYINRLDFRVNNQRATVTDHPQHIDIIKVELPAALLPGESVQISTPFQVKLPFNVSRGGHDGQSYQVTQWFPKPAVYDKAGWHPMPYLDQGEFYSEFGQFDVRITVPANYAVAATGVLQNADEKTWLEQRSNFSWQPQVKKETLKTGVIHTTKTDFPPSATNTKTLHYLQDNIHDFAWFADKRFIVNHDSCRLNSGKLVDVYSYYLPGSQKNWKESVGFAKAALRHYSDALGEYPYSTATVVEGPKSFGGGMEYPTITVIAPVSSPKSLDKVVAHELGHNWFYGILATNERDHPWMDEGINSYYEQQYTKSRYPGETEPEWILLATQAFNRKDQPVETTSADFSLLNYDAVAYYKTSQWLAYVESLLGKEAFHKAMMYYYEKWKFKHPTPQDFKTALETSSEKNLDKAFELLTKKGLLPNQIPTGTSFTFFPSVKGIKSYLQKPVQNLITAGPAIGANDYDKLLAGVFLTNIKLPPNRLQFLLAPMYSTGAKTISGVGWININLLSGGLIRKTELGASAAGFTQNQYTDDDGKKTSLAVLKIAPSIRFIFRDKNPRSTITRSIRFQSFMMKEEGLSFYRDTAISGIDTTISTKFRKVTDNTVLNRLQFVWENNRALYPWRGALVIDQGKDFVRAGFTGNYFFNYPKGGGLDVRLFAGKFFYTSSKTALKQFATDRYQLNLTGANGYEDYTYSDYFAGRNRFDGFLSQQIMNRDGAFKTRTDLLASKVGKTDNWLAALNLSTTIPKSINPLSLLPVKIPLRIYADIGTSAESWKENATTDRFLYNAGLQISLANGLVNFYLPVLSSSVFSDYYKSTLDPKGRIWKKISFTIDLSGQSGRRMPGNIFF